MGAKVFGIISIKGGVGKTTTVASLGHILSKSFNKKVLIVDGNFSAPNLGLHFGLINPEITLHHVLNGYSKYKDSIYTHNLGFDIIPANLLNKKVNPYKLKKIINRGKKDYDLIILDSSPNLNNEIMGVVESSDFLFLITTPDYPTLSTTMQAVKVAKSSNIPIAGLILNKVRNKKYELSINDIQNSTQTPVLASIRDDHKVLEALSKLVPITQLYPNSDVSKEYKKIAGVLAGVKFNEKNFVSKVKDLLIRSVDKEELNRDILMSKLKELRQ